MEKINIEKLRLINNIITNFRITLNSEKALELTYKLYKLNLK